MEQSGQRPARRRRLVVIGAGVITTLAVAAAFGSEYLRIAWIRPLAEVVILAELVGLVVLERHQIFEPVQERVNDLHASLPARFSALHANLDARFSRLEQLHEELRSTGLVTVQSSEREAYRELAGGLREALAADPGGPQILRHSRLGGQWKYITEMLGEESDDGRAFREFLAAMQLFFLRRAEAPSTPWGHLWSVRQLFVVSGLTDWEDFKAVPVGIFAAAKPLNLVIKALVRPSEAALSPTIVGESDAHLRFGDPSSPLPHWALRFRGTQYAALFSRWYDELWQLPDAFTVYGPNGLNEQEIERVRQKLERLQTPSSQG
jgi:hypothetical protein